jgi:hypothetical protein
MTDIIERAEVWLRTWEQWGSWPIMRELIAELKAARADARTLIEEKQELRDKLEAARAENERLINLLRCAREGCNGKH